MKKTAYTLDIKEYAAQNKPSASRALAPPSGG